MAAPRRRHNAVLVACSIRISSQIAAVLPSRRALRYPSSRTVSRISPLLRAPPAGTPVLRGRKALSLFLTDVRSMSTLAA